VRFGLFFWREGHEATLAPNRIGPDRRGGRKLLPCQLSSGTRVRPSSSGISLVC